MTRIVGYLVVFSLLLPAVFRAQQPERSNRLPITRAVLYKNGVGYFEHNGRVRDKQDVAITFTSGQLDDVLKSLTVLDLSGGRIGGVSYDSIAPTETQLSDLHLPVGEKASLTEFLAALRGARIEVRSGTTVITGRLLSVERKTRISGGTTLEVDYLALVSDTGELKTTELSPSFGVRVLDGALAQRVGRYLDVVSASRDAGLRTMTVTAEGTGERSLFVSYISEVPVWKATYRIVLDAKKTGSALLQGWAIVDNVVGQDWENVQLSLVAGAPQSFVQKISQPYYSRRPVVAMPDRVAGTPQTHESTLIAGGARVAGVVTDPAGAPIAGAVVNVFDAAGASAGSVRTGAEGRYEFQALPDGPIRLEVESPGFQRSSVETLVSSAIAVRKDVQLQVGSIAQSIEVSATPSSPQTSTSTSGRAGGQLGSGAQLGRQGRGFGAGSGSGTGGGVYRIEDARAQSQAAAQAQELGDLFEYKLKEPITIRKNRSALVPIVQAPITLEKVSLWNESAGLRKPQRALWLTNSSGVTLDGGSFSVLESETFAGEGLIDPIRAGEKRLVSYASDLALSVSSRTGTEAQRITRVRVARGVMTHESELRERKTYTFRNEDSAPRTVVIEHPVRPGYQLRGEARPVETTAAWMRFSLSVDPKQTSTLVVEEARPIQATVMISNVTKEQVEFFASQKSITKPIEEALSRVIAQRIAVDQLEEQRTSREQESERIFNDQERLRENLKALKGSAEEKVLVQRYTQQLNEQESRLDVLRKEVQQFSAEREKADATLKQMIQELSFDASL